MKCKNCNKETNNPKYCCKSCAAIMNNRLFPKREKVIKERAIRKKLSEDEPKEIADASKAKRKESIPLHSVKNRYTDTNSGYINYT